MIKLSEQEIENAPDYMPVVGYDGLYEVGKDGSVWSLKFGKRKQLKATPCSMYGHLHVKLSKDGKHKTRPVHQLILNAYLPKPSEDLEVLHQNSEPSDNRLENLAWGTHEENMNDPHFKALLSTPILCIETGELYPSAREAERQTGVTGQSISLCCNGKLKTAGGFHWQKVDDPHAITLLTNLPDMTTHVLCVETGILYPSMTEASRQTGIGDSGISLCCNGKLKTAGGFHWQKVDDPHTTPLLVNHTATSAFVLCVETGVMYPTVSKASQQTGVSNQSISSCLNSKQKTAGGYHWQKVNKQ